MSRSLEGVRLKLNRAAEHLQQLDEENRVYLEGKPYEVIHERDEERSRHVYRFRVRQPPPLRLSILMGDCLHNIRSGLDYLAWQLVLAEGGTPTIKTSFPIFKDEGKFREFKGGRKAPTGVVGGISEEAAAHIETLQPYNRTEGPPEGHALWVLHTLNNIDKHRHLNLTTLGTTNTQTTLTDAAGHPIFAIQLLDQPAGAGPVEDGAEIAAFPILDDHEKKVQMQGAAFVALEEAQALAHSPISSVAEASLEFVRDTVIPAFEPYFD
ncbi:hypothetical protein BH24ACT22_BH24ACT22_14000 [soil metagenome]